MPKPEESPGKDCQGVKQFNSPTSIVCTVKKNKTKNSNMNHTVKSKKEDEKINLQNEDNIEDNEDNKVSEWGLS